MTTTHTGTGLVPDVPAGMSEMEIEQNRRRMIPVHEQTIEREMRSPLLCTQRSNGNVKVDNV